MLELVTGIVLVDGTDENGVEHDEVTRFTKNVSRILADDDIAPFEVGEYVGNVVEFESDEGPADVNNPIVIRWLYRDGDAKEASGWPNRVLVIKFPVEDILEGAFDHCMRSVENIIEDDTWYGDMDRLLPDGIHYDTAVECPDSNMADYVGIVAAVTPD